MTMYEYVKVLGVECEVEIQYSFTPEERDTGTPECFEIESMTLKHYKSDMTKLNAALKERFRALLEDTETEKQLNAGNKNLFGGMNMGLTQRGF